MIGLITSALAANALAIVLLLTLASREKRRRATKRPEALLALVTLAEGAAVWLCWTAATHCREWTEEGDVVATGFLCWFTPPKVNVTWAAPSLGGADDTAASADIGWVAVIRAVGCAYLAYGSDNDKPSLSWWGWRLVSCVLWMSVGLTLAEAGGAICEWGVAVPTPEAAGSAADAEVIVAEGSLAEGDVGPGVRPDSSPWMRFIPRWDTCALIPVGQIIILSGGLLCGMLEAWLAHRRSKTLRQRQRAARRIAPADLLLLQQEAAAAANRNCWEATKQRFYGRLAGPTVREVVEQGDRFFEALAYSKACDAYRAAIARSADGLYCAELYNRMGWASLLRGDDDAALEEFEQAIKYNGLCVHSRYNLATMLLHRGDSAAAETHLRLALAPQAATAGSSDDDAARLKAKVSVNLACVLSQQGRVKEAMATLRQVLRTQPEHRLATTNLALLLLSSSAAVGGEATEEPLAEGDDPDGEPEGAIGMEATAGTAGASKQLAEACTLLRRLCTLYPGVPEVHHCLAAALHRQALGIEPMSKLAHEHTEGVKRRLVDEAIKHYTDAASLQEGNERRVEEDGRGGRHRPGAYAGGLRKGTMHSGWQLGVWERNEEATHGRAAVLASLGLAVGARREAGWKGRTAFAHRTALQLHPDFLVPSYELAKLMPAGSATQEAQLRHVLALDPDHPAANNLMARAAAKRGQRQEASTYYEQAGEESDMAAAARLPSVDHAMLAQLTYHGGGSTSGYAARRPSSAMAERYAVAEAEDEAAQRPPPKRPFSARRRTAPEPEPDPEPHHAAELGEPDANVSKLQKMFVKGVDSRSILPPGWKPTISASSGRTVFLNTVTGDTQFEAPTEAARRPSSAGAKDRDFSADGFGGAHLAGHHSSVFVKGRPHSASGRQTFTTSVRQSERSAASVSAAAARPSSAGHLRHEAIAEHQSPAALGWVGEQPYKLPRRPLSAELFRHSEHKNGVQCVVLAFLARLSDNLDELTVAFLRSHATVEERVRQLRKEAGAGFRGRAMWARDSHSIGMGSPGPVHSPPPPGARPLTPPAADKGYVDVYSGSSPPHSPPRGSRSVCTLVPSLSLLCF